MVIKAALGAGHYLLTAVALAVSLLTLFSMMKIWAYAFWKPMPEPERFIYRPVPRLIILPIVILTGLMLAMTLFTEPFLEICNRASMQLLDSAEYVNAVLGVD